MSPALTLNDRPSGAMATTVRSNAFPEFGASGRHNSDSSQSSNLGQTFGNNGTWQPSSGIWGKNTIGSAFPNTKRDASRSRAAANDDFPNGPSGSGALAASSEADPWVPRPNGPWNPDTTSPTMQSQSGSTSPVHTRNSIPNISQQTLLEIQQSYIQTRPAIGQGTGFSRSQPKSSLDPASGSFNYVRKQSYQYNEDKENSAQYLSNADAYDLDIPPRYRISNNVSREPSMPPSRISESGLNGGSIPFGNSSAHFGSIGHHTPNSSIHSQRPSISGISGVFPSQMNGSRYDAAQNEPDLSEKFGGLGLNRDIDHPTTSQLNNTFASYSPNHPNAQFNSTSHVWGNDAKANNSFEPFASQPFADQGYFKQSSRFTERSSVSPAGSDHRRGLNSPKYYSANGTPPSASDQQSFRPTSRGQRLPQGPSELDRRLQSIHYAQQQQAQAQVHYMYANQFQGQYAPQVYDFPPPTFRQGSSNTYGYPVSVNAYPQTQVIPTRPAKDQDVGVGVRSVLLEEFRSNGKGNKRYELKDIYNHVVEFSGDQHGSRFIQQKLETANSDEKEQIFREIQPNALQLMTDVFGNYVIQKLFEHGNQVQKRMLAEHMKNHVMELSMQMYGCRVVQKALEHVLADQQAELALELKADVLKCIKDQNGNHVVQKAIERVPVEHIQFVIEAFRGQVHVLATHPYGCRVIQRILEYCKPHDQVNILHELHQCATMLITDQYGNYVTQHVIQHGNAEDRTRVINIILGNLLAFSKHKFASNVVEKSIQYGTDEQRRAITAQLLPTNNEGTGPLQLLMRDQFGNYVIQKLLGQLKGAEREELVDHLKPQFLQLKKYNYGKQVLAIEKLISPGPVPSDMTPPSVTPSSRTMPIEINSTAPTPMLTNGQNSPQSSSLPSTTVSTVEDSADVGKMLEISSKPCPEVVINGM